MKLVFSYIISREGGRERGREREGVILQHTQPYKIQLHPHSRDSEMVEPEEAAAADMKAGFMGWRCRLDNDKSLTHTRTTACACSIH